MDPCNWSPSMPLKCCQRFDSSGAFEIHPIHGTVIGCHRYSRHGWFTVKRERVSDSEKLLNLIGCLHAGGWNEIIKCQPRDRLWPLWSEELLFAFSTMTTKRSFTLGEEMSTHQPGALCKWANSTLWKASRDYLSCFPNYHYCLPGLEVQHKPIKCWKKNITFVLGFLLFTLQGTACIVLLLNENYIAVFINCEVHWMKVSN